MIESIKTKIGWAKSVNFFAGLTLFFSCLLFFYDILTERFLFTERDLGPYFIPPRFFWVESIKRGDFPLWNPYQFSGHPFFANPQQAILYPLNSLFFLLPFDVAFDAIIILHFFLGGLFTYLFLKDLKVNAAGALISSLIFMLSGYLLSVHSLLTILLSVIWTPLIMMFFRRAVASPGFKNEILTAIFITVSFLGGGIEIVYGNFFVLLFMVMLPSQSGLFIHSPAPPLIRSGEGGSGGRRVLIYRRQIKPLLNRFKSLFIVSVGFLLLSAVQLIPFLELFMHSIRGKGISFHEATIWSFAPKDTLLFFLPDGYGYFLDMRRYWITQCWLKTLYTGGLPFILSMIFFFVPHRPLSFREERGDGVSGFGEGRRLFFFLMLFSLFLSLGHYNPLYPYVFKYIPFFNGIRYPVKFLYIFIFVLSVTAGLGFQRLSEFSKEGEKKRLNLLIIFSLTSGLLLLFFILGHKGIESFLKLRGIDFPDFNHLSVNLHHTKRFLFYLTVFFLLLRVGHEVKWKEWAKVLLVFFLAADLFGNMGFFGKEKTLDYFQKTKILETISSDKGNFRTFSTAKTIAMDTPILVGDASPFNIFKEKHLPSLSLLYGLHDVWGIDVVRLKRVDDLYNAMTFVPSISATNLVDLYGARYVISVTPIEEGSRLELIYSRIEGLQGRKEDLIKGNTIKLYRNHNALPRAWLVKDFRVMDSKAILSAMTDRKFEPRKEVLLEKKPNGPPASPLSPLESRTIEGGVKAPSFLTGFTKGRERGMTKGGMKELRNKVEFISESNNRLRLRVWTTENVFLVLSDTYYPGWKAFVYPVRYDSYHQESPAGTNLSDGVDGREANIYRANYNFRAIPLESGKYEIEFIYDPISFKIGTLVSLLTSLGIAVYFIKRRRLKFTSETEPQIEGPIL